MSKYQYCYTVSELNTKIRKTLNQDFSKVWVTGEVSNFHHHPNSGHMYFTVKDNSCEVWVPTQHQTKTLKEINNDPNSFFV